MLIFPRTIWCSWQNNMEASQQGHLHYEVMLLEQKCYPFTVHNMALEAYVENQDSPKISCFVWLVCRKAFPTHEVLQRRGKQICSRCFMCTLDAEIVICFFTAKQLQICGTCSSVCLECTGWFQKLPEECLIVGKGLGEENQRRTGGNWWEMIRACVWWTLWKERNARGFEDKSNNLQKIKMNCLSLLYFWCKQDRVEDIKLFVDFIGKL